MIKAFLLVSLLSLLPAHAGETTVQVHVMDPAAINNAFNDGSRGEDMRVGGWAVFAPDLSWCHVFVPPLIWQTIGIWQHEFRHCREGAYHD